MKSYFSQLAKQSGLRYGGRAVTDSPAAATARKNFGELAPIHSEQMILVAPASPKNVAPVKEKTNVLPPVKPPQKIEAKPAENNFAEFSQDVKTNRLSSEKNSDGVNQTTDSTTQIQNEILRENQSNQMIVAAMSDDLPTVEQTVFTENKITGEKNQTDLPSSETYFQPEISRQPEVKLIEAVPPHQREYFKKTAESLETTETTDKSEIQQILLHEIYEWVKDAPALAEQVNETRTTDLKQPVEVRAIAFAPVKEPSAAEPSDAAKNAVENSKSLEEQNYSLSIGTISIVVEEPPTIQNTTIQKTSVEKPKTANREFSRLSRYYL